MCLINRQGENKPNKWVAKFGISCTVETGLNESSIFFEIVDRQLKLITSFTLSLFYTNSVPIVLTL